MDGFAARGWIIDPGFSRAFPFEAQKRPVSFEYVYMSGTVMPATFGISGYVAGRLAFQMLALAAASCTAFRGSDRFAAALLILLRPACGSKSLSAAFLVGIGRR